MPKPLFSITGLSFIIFLIILTNFSPGQFLMGWDNLMPELSNLLNIKRSIFSVWQEYQGLGILAGNAHAADLPHQIIVFLLSFIAPLNGVRWIYTFGMLFLGTLGSFFLIRKLLENQKSNVPAFLGALFYLFNLATIQNFFIPFEPFITFFGFLPLLILTSINFVKEQNRKNFFAFLIISLFAIPLAEVPTIFMVYIFSLFCILVGFYLQNKVTGKISVKIILLTLLINSFWLFPFIYFTLGSTSVAFEAKINQMSTPVVFEQNKEFGNLEDVMLLKGFWFNNVDLGQIGVGFEHMFDPWRKHLSPPVTIIGYIFFAIVAVSAFSALRSKNRILWGFLFLLALSIVFLTIATPPFSFINSLLRENPLFNQAFRSPFTKFSTVASLTYAIFFAIGIRRLAEVFSNKLLGAGFVILLLIYALPVFDGHLFYSKVKTSPPMQYFDFFKFFQNQDPATRIANFPQYTFWGWSFYDWPGGDSYGGSGFLWYSVPQPILDRAFDVWGGTNENYYWEISQALYSKNLDSFDKVLNKYQISWLVIDENIVSSDSQKLLFNSELRQILKKLPNVKKVRQFGKIEVYKVDLKDKFEKFVFITPQLPRVNGYNWGSDDIAYQNLGNYISSSGKEASFDYFYPFRSLFSNKTEKNHEFEVKENNNYIDFVANLAPSENTAKLSFPSFNQIENVIPIELIQTKREDGQTLISARVKTPEVFIGSENLTKVWQEKRQNPLFLIPSNISFPLNLNINGTVNLSINQSKKEKVLGSAFLVKGQNNIAVLTNRSEFSDSQIIQTDSPDFASGLIEITLPKLESETEIIVRVKKIDDSYLGLVKTPIDLANEDFKNCDLFRKGSYSKELITIQNEKLLKLSSKNATACTSYYMPNLIHDQGYIVFLKNQNMKGNPLHFWILNEDGDYAPINTYLSKNKYLSDSLIIVPPQERFGTSYSFHFENSSIADETINYLGGSRSFPIPYNFLTSIKISPQSEKLAKVKPVNFEVSHPNETLYSVSIDDLDGLSPVLFLSQSFNPGWKAYGVNHQSSIINRLSTVFPFIFGKPVGKHVMVNNWANGWTIDSSIINHKSSIIIVYLPQYLEYFGFFVGFLAIITFSLKILRKDLPV